MHTRTAWFTTLLILLAMAACGTDPDTGNPSTSSSTIPPAVTPGTVIVAVEETSFELPAAACLRMVGDQDHVADQARALAQLTEDLAGEFASGWPTTTAPLLDEVEAREAEIRDAGVRTLILAAVAGLQADILNRWETELSEGRTANIQLRLPEWIETSTNAAPGLSGACAG